LIGGLLFIARAWQLPRVPAEASAERRTIVLSGTRMAQLRAGWVQQTGRPPTAEDDRALVDKAIEDEILYREALAHGLDRDDAVVRNRLIELARFVSESPDRDEESLVHEALALGLDRSDVVIRRHLIQTMRLFARQPAVPRPITDTDLREVLEREADRLRTPAAVTLTQVYLNESRRGDAAAGDAQRLLAKLRRERIAPDQAPSLGDPFPVGYRLSHASDRDLQKTFGASFAAAIRDVKPAQWAGPIRSSYGEHLVWIEERFPARMPALESVRARLVEELREERGQERLRERIADLRKRYTVRVEQPGPVDLAIERAAAPSSAPELPLPRRQAFLGD
jgi:peptidyl-prolyl cis-trans isomerase C